VRPRLLLWPSIAAWAAGLSAVSILRHRAFETGRFDLGNMVQAVWSTAHGRPLDVTELDGDQINRLGAHVDPLLAAFTPLWWLWPSPTMLLVAQAVDGLVELGERLVRLLQQLRLVAHGVLPASTVRVMSVRPRPSAIVKSPGPRPSRRILLSCVRAPGIGAEISPRG